MCIRASPDYPSPSRVVLVFPKEVSMQQCNVHVCICVANPIKTFNKFNELASNYHCVAEVFERYVQVPTGTCNVMGSWLQWSSWYVHPVIPSLILRLHVQSLVWRLGTGLHAHKTKS